MPVRKLLSVVAGAGLLVSLSACAAAAPEGFAGCDTGPSAALVEASGTFGADISVTFPTPLVPQSSENAVLEVGEGDRVTTGDAVTATLSVFDATNGSVIIEPSVVTAFVEGPFPFMSALTCATEGSRVAVAGASLDLLGEGVTGIEPDANVVVVADITAAFPARANGADQPAQAGFPSVVLAPNGQPGFTMLTTEPPTELKIAALKQGSGTTVKEGDNIVINLSGIVWEGTDTFFSTWTQGAPSMAVAGDLDSGAGNLPSGLAEAVIGQQVGSQLIAILPPSAGYPAGAAPEGVTETSTVVFVIDILKIG